MSMVYGNNKTEEKNMKEMVKFRTDMNIRILNWTFLRQEWTSAKLKSYWSYYPSILDISS